MARFGSLGTQYFDNSGQPLSGGKITFYNSGLDTLKNTYSDINLTTANTNPVVLDAAGRQPNVFFAGVAKAVLSTSADSIIETRDPVGDDNFGAAFSDWSASFSYPVDSIVLYSGEYYASLVGSNVGNPPSASPTEWQLLANNLLASQTTIQAGHILVGGVGGGVTSLNTKTKGTIAVGNGTTTTAVAVGTDTHVLTADSTDPEGVKWAVAPGNARNLQTFTASGTWTKPDAAQFVFVEQWGGGGGGGANTASSQIGGGSGGEYVCKWFLASDLAGTVTVTIGAGGAGGAAGTNPGSAGGTTTFGALLSSIGGNPGTSGAVFATVPRSRNASVSTGSTGDVFPYIVLPQSGYGGSSSLGGNTVYGGAGGGGNAFAGGTSAYGGNGGAGTDTLNAAGTAGTAPGGGGGGAGNGGAGGAGARGECRVWTW